MENIWQTAVEFAARAGADGFALFLLFLLLLLAILQGGRERRFRRVLVNALEKHLPQIENGISSSRETAAKERDRHATAILDALHRRVDGQTAEVADTARAALRQEIEKAFSDGAAARSRGEFEKRQNAALAELAQKISSLGVFLHDQFETLARAQNERFEKLGAESMKQAAQFSREERALAQKTLADAARLLSESMNRLAGEVDAKLAAIESRAAGGLQKAVAANDSALAATRARIAEFLAAQSRLDKTAGEVSSLAAVFVARAKSESAGGARKLEQILAAALPPTAFALDAPVGKVRAAAVLKMPVGGDIAVDAGFDSGLFDAVAAATDDKSRLAARRAFGEAFSARVAKIAQDFVQSGAARAAILFVGEEAAFAELCAYHGAAAAAANDARVWVASPTTMAAVADITRAVVREAQNRAELSRLRDLLRDLGGDLSALDARVSNVAEQIGAAHRASQQASAQSAKLTGRARGLVAPAAAPSDSPA